MVLGQGFFKARLYAEMLSCFGVPIRHWTSGELWWLHELFAGYFTFMLVREIIAYPALRYVVASPTN